MSKLESMDAAVTPVEKRRREPSTSELLEQLALAFPHERITVGELLDNLQGRALGFVLLLLALPMCIPNVPGISTVFGLLLLAPSLQLTFGGARLWLPREMRKLTFPREGLKRAVAGAAPWLRRVERLIRPRWSWVTRPPFTNALGLQTFIMAVVLLLPIPFGNWPPGVTVAITALALLQRDGLLALLSIPAAIASVITAYVGFRLGLAAMNQLIEIIAAWWPM